MPERVYKNRDAHYSHDFQKSLYFSRRAIRQKNCFMNIALWVIQVLLAALFLFAGGTKLVLPIEEMTKQMPMPGLFLRFIGLCEVLGAMGLILPWLLVVRRGLTPLAAGGLLVIMIGATITTIASLGIVRALFPLTVGLLCGFVVYGRMRTMEHH